MTEKVCQLYEEKQKGKIRQGKKARQQDARLRMGRNRRIRNPRYPKHNNRKHRGNSKNSTGTPRDGYSNSNTNCNIPRNIETTAPRNTPHWEKYSASGINSNYNNQL